MFRVSLVCCAVVLLAASAVSQSGVDAADGQVVLTQLPAVAKGVDSLPRVANPDAAGVRINADLEKHDLRLRRDIRECRKEAGKDFDWERSVEVAMRGPGYLSLFVSDSYDCGGPYPPAVQTALVYDLKTGLPVRWAGLIRGAREEDPGMVSSPALMKLYIKLMAKQSTGDMADPDCKDAFDVLDDLSFLLWPDAKRSALVLQPGDLPHSVQACANPVYVSDGDMRALGVPAAMRAAIQAAHEAQSATKQPGSSASR